MNTNENQELNRKMFVTEYTEKNLRVTAAWTKFYAILSFIGVAIMLLIGVLLLIVANKTSSLPISHPFMEVKAIGFIYIVAGIIMLIPAILLYQFSKYTKKSLIDNNVATLEVGIAKMKGFWIFMGIISIISIISAFAVIIMTATDMITAVDTISQL
ncbi:MAG: hypothetical protein GX330_02490 [Bacteroidales bacterium]|nr:hypothetical protein [Bacteroidales bacterium]